MKGEIFMDANRMKRELGGGAVFPIGAENTAYAQYFTGECYLNMLTTSGVGIGVVTFAPVRSTPGTSTTRADKSCL